MRTLCFGGSFNPIHHAHLLCARAAAENGGFDRVLLIPSARPPHKPDQSQIAGAEFRLAMCQLAVAGDPFFRVDDLELRRDGPSYTLLTARELRHKGMAEIHWLIGADMLEFLPQWHQPLQLLQNVTFHVMARPGWQFNWQKLPDAYQSLQNNILQAPLIDISATDIRNRIRAGRPIDYLTPPAVVNYIRQHNLYR
jgi:nicotinate-nucleotide adenylyltransferase